MHYIWDSKKRSKLTKNKYNNFPLLITVWNLIGADNQKSRTKIQEPKHKIQDTRTKNKDLKRQKSK